MPFQFSGTNASALITADSITAIVDGIKAQLTSVGWTVVSGSSGDWILRSALSPHNLQCQVRIYNPGSGSSARFTFRNFDGTLAASTDLFLKHSLRYPPNLRVISCPYQFFAFYPGGQGLLNQSFVCGGIPALYSFDVGVITQAVWCNGDATSDGDTSFRRSFKLKPDTNMNQAAWQLVNTNQWQNNSSGQGHLRLTASVPASAIVFAGANSGANPLLYESGEAYKTPVDISWGLTSQTDFAYIRGQMWDAAIAMDWFPQDVETEFDDHRWMNVMQVYTTLDPNPRETADTGVTSFCSLWIVVPG